MSTDYLVLKWGTLKAWDLKSEPAKAALDALFDAGPRHESAMLQADTQDQKKALCALIDAVNCDTIRNDYSGDDMTKEQAKRYVLEYRL
jgi:hypothetical protein